VVANLGKINVKKACHGLNRIKEIIGDNVMDEKKRNQSKRHKVPRVTADTRAAMEEAKDPKQLHTYESVADWWKQNNSED
jgi:hypothetical protein